MKSREALGGRRKEHSFKQTGINLERLRDEVEATMSKVVKTMMVEKLRKKEGRREWIKGKGRRGRLRVFKVSGGFFYFYVADLFSLLALPSYFFSFSSSLFFVSCCVSSSPHTFSSFSSFIYSSSSS